MFDSELDLDFLDYRDSRPGVILEIHEIRSKFWSKKPVINPEIRIIRIIRIISLLPVKIPGQRLLIHINQNNQINPGQNPGKFW